MARSSHPETVRRLACTARIQTVVEDEGGNPVAVGPMNTEPPAWVIRQVRHRDGGCTFHGCEHRRFTHVHHIRWRMHGGGHDPENLILTCAFHHRLVHEHGWRVNRARDGTVSWFYPNGIQYVPGPSPPGEVLPDVA
jgi:HNH endonuclease